MIKEIGWTKYLIYVLIFEVVIGLIGLLSNVISLLMIQTGFVGVFMGVFISMVFTFYSSAIGARFYGLMYLLGLKEDQGRELNSRIED